MATITIPTRTDLKAYSFEVSLEGRNYGFRLIWNVREEAWYLDLYDSEGSPILSGKRVVANWDLLRLVTDARRPPGQLIALDTTGLGDPGLEDLGDRVTLLYEESE